MSESFSSFDKRVRKIDRQHARLAHGYSSVVGKDGLVIIKPQSKAPDRVGRFLLVTFSLFMLFKIVSVMFLGDLEYSNRITPLANGTMVEQAGAFVLRPDPVTSLVAAKLRPYLPR